MEYRVIPVEPACRAEGWMTGERDFSASEKDAHLHTAFALNFGRARKDEGRLAEVCFAGESQHLVRGNAARIGENGEGVALQWILGEDIDLGEVVSAVSRCGR